MNREDFPKPEALTEQQLAKITSVRGRVGAAIVRPGKGLLVVKGPCALTDNLQALAQEAADMSELEKIMSGLVGLVRSNTHKPRSKEGDWKGMDQTEPHRASAIIGQLAASFGSVAQELCTPAQLARDAHRMGLGWVGARAEAAEDSDAFLRMVALADPDLPLGIKNGEDGRISNALKRIEQARRWREERGGDGEVFLIYRGGKEVRDPEAWEIGYLNAWEATQGEFVADYAHGAMRAHSPNWNIKDVEGQVAAIKHGISLAQGGYPAAGAMIESSNTPSVVDPNLPHDRGISLLIDLYEASVTAA